jgi:hypothetical protein
VNLFPPLAPESRRLLDGISGLVDKTFPLPTRFRSALPRDVAELSRLLTSGRGDRNVSYPGNPVFLSAYLRYFLPWSLYRLCRLLPALPLSLGNGDAVVDLGSGPLTLPAALWIARPELRSLSLEFRCVDQAGAALDAGKRLFAALSGRDRPGLPSPWTIKTIRAPVGGKARGPGFGPAARLVSAVNFFNELYEDLPHSDSAGLRRFADRQARLLLSLSAEKGSLLIVEPGTPRSGEFTAALRTALISRGRFPLAPCPHAGPCPCPGGQNAAAETGRPRAKGRWCHFAFDTADAAPALLKLSAAAGVPKERAALSFLYTGPSVSAPGAAGAVPALPLRIISDTFPVHDSGKDRAAFGRYGCCEKGLALIRGGRARMEQYKSGGLAAFRVSGAEGRDPKSGALVIDAEKARTADTSV